MDSSSELKAKLDATIKDMIDIARVDIVEELEIIWENSIDQFYFHYDQSWYQRTHSTYKASDAFNDINNHFFSPIDNDGAEIGIHVSSDNLGSPYKADTEWVFTRVFEKGYHGYTKSEAFEWARRKIEVNGKTVYKWKSPPLSRLNKMKVMRPAPKKLMDKGFKEFKKERLQSIVRSAFEEALKRNL